MFSCRNYENMKVVIRLQGGLGNQLFCYAAARRLAAANDAELVLDDITGFLRDKAYRRKFGLGGFAIPCRRATRAERLEPFGRFRRHALKRLEGFKDFNRRRYIKQEGSLFDARLANLKIHRNVYLDGIWPSESYFSDFSDKIRDDLRFRPEITERNFCLAQRLVETNSVAVHIRFFHRPNANERKKLVAYYSKAAKIVCNYVKHPKWIVFSDNLVAARALLASINIRASTPFDLGNGSSRAIDDLFLVSKCNHVIIGGSTFSWWGAWLSEDGSGRNVDRLIVAPENSLFDNVWWATPGSYPLPERWMVIKTDEKN